LLIRFSGLYGLPIHGLPKTADRKTRENAVTIPQTRAPAALLEGLARHDTPTICNALEISSRRNVA